jgi:hypothetical protein
VAIFTANFFRMNSATMDCQILPECKRFVTKFATKRFFTGMNSHVSVQFISVAKRFTTLLTAEQFSPFDDRRIPFNFAVSFSIIPFLSIPENIYS